MVTDPTARVAEMLSGGSDITAEVPVEEFARLSAQAGLKGVRNPIADMAELFVSPRFEPFQKEEVRLAVHHWVACTPCRALCRLHQPSHHSDARPVHAIHQSARHEMFL